MTYVSFLTRETSFPTYVFFYSQRREEIVKLEDEPMNLQDECRIKCEISDEFPDVSNFEVSAEDPLTVTELPQVLGKKKSDSTALGSDKYLVIFIRVTRCLLEIPVPYYYSSALCKISKDLSLRESY